MASGRLGFSNVTAATNTVVYTVPASKTASFSINICNRNVEAATVRIALSSTSTPVDGEYIEYGMLIISNGILERTGLILDAGKNVVVYSDIANISVVIYGVEE